MRILGNIIQFTVIGVVVLIIAAITTIGVTTKHRYTCSDGWVSPWSREIWAEDGSIMWRENSKINMYIPPAGGTCEAESRRQ